MMPLIVEYMWPVLLNFEFLCLGVEHILGFGMTMALLLLKIVKLLLLPVIYRHVDFGTR